MRTTYGDYFTNLLPFNKQTWRVKKGGKRQTKRTRSKNFQMGLERSMTYGEKPGTSDPKIAEPDVFLKPGKGVNLYQL